MTTGAPAGAVDAMLCARSIAIVGASPRADSFGARLVAEVSRSTGDRQIDLVNPNHRTIDGRACLPSLKHLDTPPDLVLLAVGDDALENLLVEAAQVHARSAVIFGGAHGAPLRESLRRIATGAGMALCGAGCMGFVNVDDGLRAIGYLEREQLLSGPIAMITHSGSVFSTLLRTRRALGFTVAVSSGQELVTTSADYLDHVLAQTDTRVVALVLETVRNGPQLVAGLRRAAERDVAVVVLPVGGSPLGAALVTAHSGALAGEQAMWEALAEGTGARLVSDLAELTDTLELLSIARRARPGGGLATVHDSGAERTLVADLADKLNVSFAPLSTPTLARLDELLDDGLVAQNPLDLWGNGADTRTLFADSLRALSDDPAVSVVALAVDLVEEYDGDTSYVDAALAVSADIAASFAVLTSLASALDLGAAARLRAAGVPVLEGTRSGLVALKHLLAIADNRPPVVAEHSVDGARLSRWQARLNDESPLNVCESFAMLADYGVPTAAMRSADDVDAAVAAADAMGYPVVLKTDAPGVSHKSDVGGVVVGIADAKALRNAYAQMSPRLGDRVLVCATAPAGVELALGVVCDPQLGPLVVVGAGGVLAELLADRAVALPPISRQRSADLLSRLRIQRLLDGWRRSEPADLEAVLNAISAVATLAVEIGDCIEALDINPLIASSSGAIAVDALIVHRPRDDDGRRQGAAC